MANYNVEIKHIDDTVFYGLWTKTSDGSLSVDIPRLAGLYYTKLGVAEGSVLPFVVLSKDRDAKTYISDLFIGSTKQGDELDSIVLPAGDYACITVGPKFGFAWGPSIGGAKKYFYNEWLPKSEMYEAVNLEYEFHTEKTVGKKPLLDIVFAIRKKA